MKAIVVRKYGGPEVLQVEEVPIPKPGKNEVLIRIHAAGVNPVETYIRGGLIPGKLPYTPGADGAGVIEAVGDGVTRFKKGERVFCFTHLSGTYAQYALCEEHACFPLPGKTTFQQGAAIGVPYFTAYRALFQTGKRPSAKSVLIHGASGGVGLASVQMAKAAGMTVYGTAGTEDGLKLVKETGADMVFNHREKDYVEKLTQATGGKGVDMILEMVGNANMSKDLALIKNQGIIAVIGSHGKIEIDSHALLGKEPRICGILLLNATEEDVIEAGAAVVKGLENGTLDPVIDKEYSMEQAPAVHKDIMESTGAKGKLVILTK